MFVDQTFIDNIMGAAVYSVPDLILLKANPIYLDFMDSPFNKEEDSIGRPIKEIVTGFVGSKAQVIWNNVLETQKTRYVKGFEFDKYVRGITYWDSTKTPIFEKGKMKYIFETAIDVTERVLKNQDIQRQNKIIQEQKEELERKKEIEKYKMLFNAIDEGFCIIEMIFNSIGKPVDYRFIEINLAFEKQTGLQNAVGKLMRDLKPDHEEHWFEIYGKVCSSGESVRFINEAKELNRWYSVFAFKLDTRVALLFKDITDEVKFENEIKKNKELEEFVANISHELKTPLNVIFTTAQLFEMYCSSGSLDEKKSSIIKYIHSIKQNAYRLSKLINNIVDTSKIEAGLFELNLSNNNIVEVVEEIVVSVTDFIDSKGLGIVFDTDIEEKIIACDPEKVERILLNLISNAIKFSNNGDEIFIDIKDKNEFVEISVKDSGIGIERKDLDMIFDRFKQVDKSLTRNAEGTGIGLNLVKSIVELHSGSISVESEYGKGSKFTVVLPTKKVMQENMLLSNKIRNIDESILVELSDIY